MNTLKDKTAVVGVGSTPYYKRGESVPQTAMELAGKAVIAALDDAGLTVDDLDGFALYSMGFDTSLFAQWLGVPDVKFTAMLTGGGGGAAGSVGLASAAIVSGMAECVVSVMTLQQAASRFGASFAPRGSASGATYSAPPSPEGNFIQPSGLMAPGQMFAVLAQRHMHLYGTTREHFCEVALSTRANAIRRPTSLMQEPLDARAVLRGSDDLRPALPLRLLPRVRRRGRGRDDVRRAGARPPASACVRARVRPRRSRALGAGDHVDGHAGRRVRVVGPPPRRAAALRDGRASGPTRSTSRCSTTTSRPMVIMQLEDYGFCGIGEGGPFVADGNIRWPDGGLP